MEIQYGVKITTSKTGLNDYQLGCIDGVLKWATGRDDLGEFKNGIILEDSLSSVSQAIEIPASGSYATLSAFSLKIDNALNFADTIRDLGLNLSQADAVFYSFRRETEEDEWETTQDWSGKVLDWNRDEDEIEIRFMDSFRGIHKPLLKKAIGISEFPKAPAESIGEFIPVSIGRVAHAKLLNIQDDTEKIICATVAGQAYKFCAATEYPVGSNYHVIALKTEDAIFIAGELTGNTLTVIHGGSAQSRKIMFNEASAAGETVISFDRDLDVSTAFIAWSPVIVTDDVWYFEITKNKSNFAVSQNEINSFVSPDLVINNYNSFVEIFKSATKKFSKILGIDFTKSLSDVDGTGYPGFSLLTKFAGSQGKAVIFTAIKPSAILLTAKSYSGSLSGSFDGLGSPLSIPANLIDRLHSTGYSFAWSIANTAVAPWPANVFNVTYEITIPQDVMEEDFFDIYVLPDLISVYGGGTFHYVYMTVSVVDFYGRDPVPVVPEFEIISNFGIHNFLHENYFSLPTGISGTGNHFGTSHVPGSGYAKFEQFSAKAVISSAAKLGIYNKFTVNFRVYQGDGIGSVANAAIDFRELGLISAYEFDLSKENFYVKILGETFGSTWDGRKTAAEPIENIAEAIEAAFRNFDNAPEFVDADSFDIIGNQTTGLLRNFYIGRQFTEEVNSANLIDELCRFSFLGLVPRNNGTKALKSWMDGSVIATHNDTNNTINKNSIGKKEQTNLSDIYNEPQVNYGWNPALEKFDAFLRITRIDEASFPLEATLDEVGNPLWMSFAIGYNDDEYEESRDNWNLCHLSWSRYGLIRPLPKEMADAKWFPNVEADWGLSATYNAAKAYMRRLCRWTPFRKDMVPYNLPNTATHASLELLDRIAFSDSTDRDGAEFEGAIVEKTIVPGLGKDYIEIQLMLDPDLGDLE